MKKSLKRPGTKVSNLRDESQVVREHNKQMGQHGKRKGEGEVEGESERERKDEGEAEAEAKGKGEGKGKVSIQSAYNQLMVSIQSVHGPRAVRV